VIQPRQILVLSLDNLVHRLLDIGYFSFVGLHQRCIGRVRFLMKTLENFRHEAAAE
jgi:hypothetical protein